MEKSEPRNRKGVKTLLQRDEKLDKLCTTDTVLRMLVRMRATDYLTPIDSINIVTERNARQRRYKSREYETRPTILRSELRDCRLRLREHDRDSLDGCLGFLNLSVRHRGGMRI